MFIHFARLSTVYMFGVLHNAMENIHKNVIKHSAMIVTEYKIMYKYDKFIIR